MNHNDLIDLMNSASAGKRLCSDVLHIVNNSSPEAMPELLRKAIDDYMLMASGKPTQENAE